RASGRGGWGREGGERRRERKGRRRVGMSARKRVTPRGPRALARAAASRVAGAVCFDTADDAKLPPTRRSSRPPSNSSANADSSMSPAPSGITASVLAECPVQSATPLYLSPPRRIGSCPTKRGGRARYFLRHAASCPTKRDGRASRASLSAQRRQF